MTGETTFDDELARRLPLPLAQLYRRAHNAKTDLERHNAAYYLWEAALKLLGAAAIVAYAERNEPTSSSASGSRTWRGPHSGTGGSSSGSCSPRSPTRATKGSARPGSCCWDAAATTCPRRGPR